MTQTRKEKGKASTGLLKGRLRFGASHTNAPFPSAVVCSDHRNWSSALSQPSQMLGMFPAPPPYGTARAFATVFQTIRPSSATKWQAYARAHRRMSIFAH